MAYGSHSAPGNRARKPAGSRGGRVAAVNGGNTSRPLPRNRGLVGVRGRPVFIDVQAPPPFMQVPPQYALGDSEDDLGQFGFSLGKTFKNIGKAVKKGVVDVGHGAGAVVTSKIGQGVLGTALAVTGVGAPAAALIFGATKGTGNLIKKGGNLKHFATGVAQGAVEGVVSVGAGKAVRAIGGKILNRGAKTPGAASAGTAAARSALVDRIANGAIPGVRVTPNANDPTTWDESAPPSVTREQIASTAAQAEAIAQAQQAQAYAEASRAEAARQAAELQAQLNAARQAANDAQAQQLQAQLAQSQAQADAATRAAQAAQAAAEATKQQAPGADTSQLDALVKAAVAAAQAARSAADAPPTPQATQRVQQETAAATDGATDAAAGAPTESGLLGNINPMFLIGGVALLAVVMSKKNRRTRGA